VYFIKHPIAQHQTIDSIQGEIMISKITPKTKFDYSLVIPVYLNEGCLFPLTNSIIEKVMSVNPTRTSEIIFVEDGSKDNSLDELLELRTQHPDLIKIIKFSRNFGQNSAIIAGLSHASGKCAIVTSADGQDPPELINDMLKAYFEDGYEIAVCTRKSRDGSLFRAIASRIAYSIIKKLTFPNMPVGGFDYVLLGNRALEVYLRNLDSNTFFQGLILWSGFKIKYIEYHRKERISGKSAYTLWKMLFNLIDAILAFSYFPIRVMSLTGIILAILGFIYAIDIIGTKVFYGVPIQGWAPIMVVLLVTGGIQILMSGIIGEYIWRILSQVRNRDLFVIESLYGNFDSHSLEER
jgi:polyisoprenyl-phosphate glycosyltransferase